MPQAVAIDPRLARSLVLDELFDLSLYRRLREFTPPELHPTLEELIAVEQQHFAFWQRFFGIDARTLDFGRRVKLGFLTLVCRLFGPAAVHLVLEAIEVHGVRKYLALWERYRDTSLGAALRGILEDEFKHEDVVVTKLTARKINPDRIRNIFLGLNDGLVEILGAVSGFFGAFGDAYLVMIAGLTTAVAGSLSMAAGAYVAASSETEVARTQRGKRRFLGEDERDGDTGEEPPLRAAATVGASYFGGAVVALVPVVFGAHTALPSVAAAGVTIILVSTGLAFLSGMDVRRRVGLNLIIIAAAAGITFAIGTAVRALFGVEV
jgi:VIT1/CCC1 family predicted Fe2+/Mn2+ transporter